MVGAALRYALLLYMDPVRAAATTAAEARRELTAYAAITDDLAQRGLLHGGEAFLPAEMARFVRGNGEHPGDDAVTSGDRELSGFYIVACDEEQALEIAASMPVVDHGVVEVRPLLDLPQPGASSDDAPS